MIVFMHCYQIYRDNNIATVEDATRTDKIKAYLLKINAIILLWFTIKLHYELYKL